MVKIGGITKRFASSYVAISLVGVVCCQSNPSVLAGEVRLTFRCTQSLAKITESTALNQSSAQVDLLANRLAKAVSARSVRFICLNEQYGPKRANVINAWGVAKADQLGIPFFELLLNSSDRRLRLAVMFVFQELASKPRYRTSLGRIISDFHAIRYRHGSESNYFAMKIALIERGNAAVTLLKAVALEDSEHDRSIAINDLFLIGTLTAHAALIEIEAHLREQDLQLSKRLFEVGVKSTS